jgi:hypothetical protein
MSKFKVGQLAILTVGILSCGCSYADKGTICKIAEDSGNNNYEIQLCNNGCTSPVYSEQLREVTVLEKYKAVRRFNKATTYEYTSIN